MTIKLNPQNIKRTGGEATLEEFSKSVAKGKAPHFSAIGGVRGQAGSHRGEGGSDAGADTERTGTAKYNVGGKNPDVALGQAAETKTKGHVGVSNVKGPGKKFGGGGPVLRDVGRGAVPQEPGQSGQPSGRDAGKSLKGV
jgi:hypothetical protein